MRVLVFQHISVEHPGVFRDFLAADGGTMAAVELDEGAPIPPLDGFDALWAMGGPMDVWQDAQHPWLIPEKQAIRDWVGSGKPFLGICLGHQLLVDAMGGRVGPGEAPEVGVLPVDLTSDGQRDPLFRGIAPQADCLQWHGAAVLEPPRGSAVLARSPVCPIQAVRVGARAYGLQYHVEVTADTVPEWGCIPEYAASLDAAMGEGALQRLRQDTENNLAAFNAMARRIYDNFMAIAAGAPD